MANDGLEALEKIRKVSSIENESDGQAFDCVLMDLEMPGEFQKFTAGFVCLIYVVYSNGRSHCCWAYQRRRKRWKIEEEPGHRPE